MAALTIKDLRTNYELDRSAMSSIRGAGGAPWVYGWIRPYSNQSIMQGQGTVVNFFQVNNYADQMINQIQVIDVNNTGANANINVSPNEKSINVK